MIRGQDSMLRNWPPRSPRGLVVRRRSVDREIAQRITLPSRARVVRDIEVARHEPNSTAAWASKAEAEFSEVCRWPQAAVWNGEVMHDEEEARRLVWVGDEQRGGAAVHERCPDRNTVFAYKIFFAPRA